ncbi:hypothetical protein AR546_11970 [Leptospira interrogans serovar Canicola]|nr:hypothetical protein B2G47_13245 [Leptospira interrogans serovar Canicola]OMH72697.1 hypothetical protein BW243_02365 [Leptospira interrogans serovar Pomona]OOB94422.1 hypothetical protein B0191_11775 [Leptospira interrogans serovar Hardjo]ASV08714.1 hypothetical protein B2G50_06710 [Leptospira interrogans serovar Canicola]OLZ31177.1 hypothetical protein AR546_11970 [Leptospira interrogans serovar Canicola]
MALSIFKSKLQEIWNFTEPIKLNIENIHHIELFECKILSILLYSYEYYKKFSKNEILSFHKQIIMRIVIYSQENF